MLKDGRSNRCSIRSGSTWKWRSHHGYPWKSSSRIGRMGGPGWSVVPYRWKSSRQGRWNYIFIFKSIFYLNSLWHGDVRRFFTLNPTMICTRNRRPIVRSRKRSIRKRNAFGQSMQSATIWVRSVWARKLHHKVHRQHQHRVRHSKLHWPAPPVRHRWPVPVLLRHRRAARFCRDHNRHR